MQQNASDAETERSEQRLKERYSGETPEEGMSMRALR